MLQEIVADHSGMGIAVALIGSDGDERFVINGPEASYDTRTRFEIGSVTKSLTGMLLALMTAEGKVALDDPVNDYLPDGTRLPDGSDGRAITLADLSRHRSGLPRLPAGVLPPDDPLNPYEGFDEAKLLHAVGVVKLESEPGEKVAYSNFGTGLLGYALARAKGSTYAELLDHYLFGPLDMQGAVVGDASSGELAQPHAVGHVVQPDWDLDALAAAGGVRASIDDMAKYARIFIDRPDAFAAAVPLLFEGDASDGLGLFRRAFGDREVAWHNGATAGSRSMMVIDVRSREAVVVLMNSHAGPSPDDLALHLLAGRPLP